MAITDRETFKQFQIDQLAGYVGQQGVTAPDATVRGSHRRQYESLVADAATAGTAVTETVMAHVQRASRPIAVTISTPIAVTASDSNYATFTIAKRTAAGSAVTLATIFTKTGGSSGTGNLAAFVPYVLPLTYANFDIAAGDVLTVAISKTGSGVALTAATSYVNVTVDVEEV
jgi:hypothetical protein